MSIIQPTEIPAELIARPQWVLWRSEDRDGRPTKVPYQPRMRLCPARTNDPRTWASFELAHEMWLHHGERIAGLGFVFTADDPFCGIDLDNCYPSDAAECAPWSEGILDRFGDSYAEQSPSDRGVKIWVKALAPRCGQWPVESGAIEIYDRLRYFTVTARSNRVLTIADHQEDIAALIAYLDQERGAAHIPTIAGGAIGGTIPQGRRHPTLVSLAGSMWHRGMDAAAIEAALLVTNERQCEPPYSPQHIRKIVESMHGWPR